MDMPSSSPSPPLKRHTIVYQKSISFCNDPFHGLRAVATIYHSTPQPHLGIAPWYHTLMRWRNPYTIADTECGVLSMPRKYRVRVSGGIITGIVKRRVPPRDGFYTYIYNTKMPITKARGYVHEHTVFWVLLIPWGNCIDIPTEQQFILMDAHFHSTQFSIHTPWDGWS